METFYLIINDQNNYNNFKFYILQILWSVILIYERVDGRMVIL